jgi:hypothetical protein
LLAAILAIAGCSSSGVKVTDNQAAEFVKGKSTEAEVIAKLGPPWTQRHDRDGTKIDMYIYSHAAVRAGTFVPYLGPLLGGMNTANASIRFDFTPDGVLKDWSSAASEHSFTPINGD